jgi:AcrR family transcriptional regulator
MDRHLLDAGKKLLLSYGISGLSIRQISETAQVNPGMFHYHFKTKEQFTLRLLGEVYESMFEVLAKEFEREASTRDPLERLRGLLTVIGRSVSEGREILAPILREALYGEPTVIGFIKENFPRHLGLLAKAVTECQSKNKIRRDLSLPQIMVLCGATLNAPVIFGTLLGGTLGIAKTVNSEIIAPSFLEARIDFLLRGLAP